MTTKELIQKLQELDPSGTMRVQKTYYYNNDDEDSIEIHEDISPLEYRGEIYL